MRAEAWATVVSGLALVLAAISAAYSAAAGRKASRSAAEHLDVQRRLAVIEADRHLVEQEGRRQEHVMAVALGHSPELLTYDFDEWDNLINTTSAETQVTVKNRGSQPIRDVAVWVESPTGIASPRAQVGSVGAGGTVRKMVAFPGGPQRENAPFTFVAVAEFTDVAGVRWHRFEDGRFGEDPPT